MYTLRVGYTRPHAGLTGFDNFVTVRLSVGLRDVLVQPIRINDVLVVFFSRHAALVYLTPNIPIEHGHFSFTWSYRKSNSDGHVVGLARSV